MKIGLEVHAYARTKSKMHCACSSAFLEGEPNTLVCETCTSQPGAKPNGVNREAVSVAKAAAALLGCEPKGEASVLRKHYFYPDLPSNYQRTSTPVGVNGVFQGVRIREIHFEEDPGQFDLKKKTLDFNRSGVPLMEIVTEPDLKSPEEAKSFVERLQAALLYNELIRPELGLKIDTNVSVAGGNRVEVKNVHSVKGMVAAIRFEEKRQREAVSSGQKVRMETRNYDEASESTTPSREKETEADYRYLPDPDLPAIDLSKVEAKAFTDPFKEVERLSSKLKISTAVLETLVLSGFLKDFEESCTHAAPGTAAFFYSSVLKGELEYRGLSASPLTAKDLKPVLTALDKKQVTQQGAAQLLRELLDKGTVSMKTSISREELEKAVREVLQSENAAVAKVKAGEVKVIEYLLGRVFKKLGPGTQPGDVRREIKRVLGRL
ncbi:MAG TPA: Asp-tRNA(Asn)/Glu-tRNA(Gln) amidotransferase subunit GatB [archaeon]|nr:Asp-tRNA(Asn)/Glu-tRNA(Gln) amidotransferase subunit GatB [archaeon]